MRIAVFNLTGHPLPLFAGLPRAEAQIINWLSTELPEAELSLILKIEPTPVPVTKTATEEDGTYKAASGTSFYVSVQGHIITNHHVIKGF